MATVDKEKRWDLRITLIGVVVGGLIGFLSNFLFFKFALQQKNQDKKEALLAKKIDLIDQTAKIFYQLPGTKELIEYGVYKNIDTVKTNIITGRIDYIVKDIQVSKELSTARADFFSILIQDKLYFGPKTRNKIDSLFKENEKEKRSWWETEDTTYIKLLEIMMSEL